QHRIVDVNEHWLDLFGYARDEVIGRKLSEFHAHDDSPLHEARWQKMLERGVLRDVERQFVRKSGEVFDGVTSAYLELDPEGKFLRTITTVIDITARKRAEEQLRRERQLSELLIESGTESIIGLDRDLRYIAWNPAMKPGAPPWTDASPRCATSPIGSLPPAGAASTTRISRRYTPPTAA